MAKFAKSIFYELGWIGTATEWIRAVDCRRFGARSLGYIRDIVLFGKEDTKVYWYNPTTRTSERVVAPSTDVRAIQMLAGTQDSAEFVKEYCELRRSGTPIEQALVLVGHEFRLRQPEYQLALR
jgi:hypothetical protein